MTLMLFSLPIFVLVRLLLCIRLHNVVKHILLYKHGINVKTYVYHNLIFEVMCRRPSPKPACICTSAPLTLTMYESIEMNEKKKFANICVIDANNKRDYSNIITDFIINKLNSMSVTCN